MNDNASESKSHFHELRHADLLVAIIALLVIESFLSTEDHFQSSVLNCLFFLVVLAAVRTLSRSRRQMWLALAMGILAYVLSWFQEFYPSPTFAIGMSACFILVFAQLIIVLAKNVFEDGPVDANRIIGAISIYFMLGLAWAFIYAVLELASPGSFHLTNDSSGSKNYGLLIGELMYFSQVTLTSLGYGDLAPISKPARTFSTLQAMVGQLYVAIVIARLVSLQISQKRKS